MAITATRANTNPLTATLEQTAHLAVRDQGYLIETQKNLKNSYAERRDIMQKLKSLKVLGKTEGTKKAFEKYMSTTSRVKHQYSLKNEQTKNKLEQNRQIAMGQHLRNDIHTSNTKLATQLKKLVLTKKQIEKMNIKNTTYNINIHDTIDNILKIKEIEECEITLVKEFVLSIKLNTTPILMDTTTPELNITENLKHFTRKFTDLGDTKVNDIYHLLSTGQTEKVSTKIIIDPLDIEILINLKDSSQYTIFGTGNSKYKAYGDQFLPHPHWIVPDAPCLGDFEPPIQEAVYEADYVTAITILILFLKSYDPQDSAGSHFPVWWLFHNLGYTLEENHHNEWLVENQSGPETYFIENLKNFLLEFPQDFKYNPKKLTTRALTHTNYNDIIVPEIKEKEKEKEPTYTWKQPIISAPLPAPSIPPLPPIRAEAMVPGEPVMVYDDFSHQ